ncbi:hypothetical protein XA68_10775 [Ophiocordyceps unilateralis]|uniref:O-methyltransferase C-terminal domain-containing protein n=1 Tax=Ophiocordyceps unilateralis TaxID=268505 RepID=A0A2A9NYD4_OPHUN|nr:hypothetical protein XA68_10775 [Ophiocordyceps unilateralis]
MSQLSSLALRLSKLANEMDAYTSDVGIAVPGIPELPAKMAQSRRELLELAEEIQVLVRDVPHYLEHQQIHYQTFTCLRWLLRFDIFNHVPENSTPISYGQLAAAASVPAARLRSVVRMAMTSGLFTEAEAGRVAHNPLSLSLAKNESFRDWAHFMVQYGQPSAAALAEATARWGDSEAINETAQNVAFQTDLSYFETMQQREGAADEFARYMKAIQQSSGLCLQQLVKGLDWSERFGERAHIVDVGGSTGNTSVSLAKAYPAFTFTVQDLPETTDLGPKALASQPDDIRDRISFMGHDFFTAQPDMDMTPDVYLLRLIIHDWPREKARIILSHLAAGLKTKAKPGGRIVIMETVLPPPAVIPLLREARLRSRDLTMMENFNSGERELDEWKQLLASTHPKLQILHRTQPPESLLDLMVVGLSE